MALRPVQTRLESVQDVTDRRVGKAAVNDVGMPTSTLAYKRWLLYVRPGDRGSVKAMKLAVQVESDVQMSNIDKLPRSQRPSWLDGVPALLDLQTKRVFKGGQALVQLQNYVSSEPLAFNAMNSKYMRLGGSGEEETVWGTAATAHDYILPDLDDDPRYRSQAPVTGEQLTALRSTRGLQDSEVKLLKN